MTVLDAQAVLSDIRQAFADVQLGLGVGLHESEVIDGYGSASQRQAARLLDTEQYWWEVPDRAIGQPLGSLSFMDAAGLRFYVPAYLSWSIRHGLASDSISRSDLLATLRSVSYAQERFSLFSAEQASAVASALAYLLEQDASSYDAEDYLTAHDQWIIFAYMLAKD